MDFCHIAPTAYLRQYCFSQKSDLLLAHLVESDSAYREFYTSKPLHLEGQRILDNSAFEMYKQGREMYPSDKLLEMAQLTNCQYIVLTDYPNDHWLKTVDKAIELAPVIRNAGYKTFFVPQSQINDEDNLIRSFIWAAQSPLIDYIGISILAAPNAYGVEKANKLQRFVSRWKLIRKLQQERILTKAVLAGKKIHMLGMVDGPNEISLIGSVFPSISTWDSSAAVWAGINGISFDQSPTGLIGGKFEKEVDFTHQFSNYNANTIANNVAMIDQLAKEYPY